MTDTGEIQSKNLIKNFVHDILNDDIDRLKEFSFLNLHTDMNYIKDKNIKIQKQDIKKYGGFFIQKGYKHTLHQYANDYDDMNLIPLY